MLSRQSSSWTDRTTTFETPTLRIVDDADHCSIQGSHDLDQSSKPPVKNLTPDYEHPALRKVLRQFIAELGRKYDGDPRIGFITAGLLGHWGEWHTYPQEKLFASKAVQAEVLDAYAAAFSATHVLLRYPAGAENSSLAPNAERAFGYHDDSFAWATLDTGRKEDAWFYLAAAKVTAGAPDKSRFSAMAKKLSTDNGSEIVDKALQMFGGYGYLKDYPIERFWRDLRVHRILEGTNEVMRMIIGRDLLK